jgi:hypothetical protein
VIGSYLQKYAYPDYWKLHVDQNKRELKNWVRGKDFDKKGSGETQALEEFRNVVKGTSGRVGTACNSAANICIVAEGKGGFRVYDMASIGNKGFSEPIVSGPFSKLSHNTHVKTKMRRAWRWRRRSRSIRCAAQPNCARSIRNNPSCRSTAMRR